MYFLCIFLRCHKHFCELIFIVSSIQFKKKNNNAVQLLRIWSSSLLPDVKIRHRYSKPIRSRKVSGDIRYLNVNKYGQSADDNACSHLPTFVADAKKTSATSVRHLTEL